MVAEAALGAALPCQDVSDLHVEAVASPSDGYRVPPCFYLWISSDFAPGDADADREKLRLRGLARDREGYALGVVAAHAARVDAPCEGLDTLCRSDARQARPRPSSPPYPLPALGG